ncbi:class I SAM-dependent methyltransferase [Marimonas sp. MJW-29]|uniref:Class I SAM-dependent methyltransferase n=1 Tax=Sulfitobacter sediminis TaxID=3234186 RepID=A0ABV3RK47_9RHOB
MTSDPTQADLARACYRVLLGREPENERVVEERTAAGMSPEEMMLSFIRSDEYRKHTAEQMIHDYLMANHDYDSLDIEVDVPGQTLARMFERIKAEWAALGETEPYWSVITAEEFRSANIRKNLEVFFQSGQTNIHWMQNLARRNGIETGTHQTCFELGCGVGRLTLPLSELFGHVTAFDISPGNLRECEALIAARGRNNITTRLMTEIETIHEAPEFDVLFSIIVLQHNPPPVQKYLLDVLLSKIRPGGIAYFQLPTYIPQYSFAAEDYLASPPGEMEMHAVPMRHVLALLSQHGFRLLEVLQDQFTGMPGSHSFLAVRDGAA